MDGWDQGFLAVERVQKPDPGPVVGVPEVKAPINLHKVGIRIH